MKPLFTTPLLLILLAVLAAGAAAQSPFKCNATSKCHALIEYPLPNSTTLSALQTLFSLKNLRSLLGANNLPLSTSPNLTLPAQQPVKIPFPCFCRNSTGISNRRPIYTVVSGDTLSHIAEEVFARLVTFQEIGTVNNIPNFDEIEVGEKLWIPLPCSCDEVGGVRVVHYGHVVETGSSLGVIAATFGTTTETLMELNGVNDSSLLAGQVLDVPLPACNSSVLSDSLDYPLLVANNTYVFTANNCVKCKCDSANNWILQCEPSGIKSSNWTTCPSMQCEGSDNLYIGNSTTSGCNRTTCAYTGFYSNQTILSTLVTESTCGASSPGGDGSFGSRVDSSWSFFIITMNLILLYVMYLC